MANKTPKRNQALAGLIVAVSVMALGIWQAVLASADPAVPSPAATYSVLKRATTAQDASVRASQLVAHTTTQHPELGLRPDEARALPAGTSPTPGTTVTVIPASAAPCLYKKHGDGSEGLSCGSSAGRTASVGYEGSIGLVPDQVQTVTFTMTDGSQRSASVVDNLWKSPPEAAKVSFVVAGQSQEIDLMPRSTLPAGASISKDGLVTVQSGN